jgi:hypothetical protein
MMSVIKLLVLAFFLASSFVLIAEEQKGSLSDSQHWHYAVDPHGSAAFPAIPLVKDGIARIRFVRVPRVDVANNSWVELIYTLPNGNITAYEGIVIRYQSSSQLVVKLSQADYGAEGDKTYAHYQITLPAAASWHTEKVAFADFSRPDWTPASSVDKGIIKQNVNAIYLVPDLTDAQGGEAEIAIKALELW